jgi:glutathione S-transferase
LTSPIIASGSRWPADRAMATVSEVMRFYRAPFSTNVERVALALAHKGLAVESVFIDYSDRSEVERVSGQELVPVIDDDGTVVVDSMEIIHYLEERYPVAPLFPAGEARRAEVLIFIDWFNRVWKAPPNEIEAELVRADPDHERIAGLAGTMGGALDRFEAMLAGRDHLMDNDFCAADCGAFPFLKYALFRDPTDDELFHRILSEHQQLGDNHPRLADWICRINARPRA